MTTRFALLPLAFFACAAAPAWAGTLAGSGATVDEPAALALLALGVIGLIVGRHVARHKD